MRIIFITLLTLLVTVSCKQKEDSKPSKEVERPEVLMACTKEAKQCPDGSVVGRNPKNNCEFNSCPKVKISKKPKDNKGKMCTAEMKECSDGSLVGRDHYNNCEFRQCPPTENGRDVSGKGNSVMCTADVKQCPDGSYVGRDHNNNCKFKTCPESDADSDTKKKI